MPYEGDLLNLCPVMDFSNTEAVVVSGASWNPCGHMILCSGTTSDNCWYFHVAGQGVMEVWGVYAYPKFMHGDGNFRRYLSENGKTEIRRLNANISNPSAAYDKLIEFMDHKWKWGVLINNCASFVKEIVQAGGGNLSVLLNCPDQEVAKKIIRGAIEGAIMSIVPPFL